MEGKKRLKMLLKETVQEIKNNCDVILDLEIDENDSNAVFEAFFEFQVYMHELINVAKEKIDKNKT